MDRVLLIERHHVPKEAALFVLRLVRAARRALLSAEGYQVERALAVLDQWMEDAADRAAGCAGCRSRVSWTRRRPG